MKLVPLEVVILEKNNWDTNAITPGTTFMLKLTYYLKA